MADCLICGMLINRNEEAYLLYGGYAHQSCYNITRMLDGNLPDNELLPCPFCGKEAKIIERINGVTDIGCDDLLCFGGICTDTDCLCEDGWTDREEAIKKWNQRANNGEVKG